ncbi:Alpha/Beta hydrolase protein [Chytridium lagenaria]|nr:Alpha/Beta hydrolase protein [Chytridium lagenaria]
MGPSPPWSTWPTINIVGYLCTLCLFITPLRLIVYLSPCISAIALLEPIIPAYLPTYILPKSTYAKTFVTIYCTIETIWSIYYATTKRRLSKHSDNPPKLRACCGKSILNASDEHSVELRLFLRCRQEVEHVEKLISRWFLGSPNYSTLKLDDIRDWLSWAFFSKTRHALDPQQKSDLEAMIDCFQSTTVKRLPEGSTKEKCIRLNLDELRSQVRPFLFYLITMAVDAFAASMLVTRNFEKKISKNGKVTFWISPGKSSFAKMDDPIFFVHGIGVGLVSYIAFVDAMLKKFPNRRIILLELRHVSMQLADEVPNISETLASIDELYLSLRIKKAVWMGHSLGSVICSWMCKLRPQLMSQVIFIDPIVFALYEPDVAYNFLYRNPSNGFQLLMWFLASQELYISHALRRHFWWYQGVIFPQDLPDYNPITATNPTHVFISQNDQIISCDTVARHLERHHVNVKVWKGYRHGQFAFKPEAREEVLRTVM